MKNITLISDWKLKDPYVATFKGQIARYLPDATIFDITHAIQMFDVEQTAFILKNSYPNFPEKTLHVILTASTFSVSEKPILITYQNHFFLGVDNGIFSLVIDNLAKAEAVKFNDPELQNLPFTEKLTQMIAWHFNGELAAHTTKYSDFGRKIVHQPKYDEETRKLTGKIIYIDSFCNAVTDIPVSMFLEARGDRPFVAKFGNRKFLKITKFHNHYESSESEIFLVANRMGYLEITMYRANIAILADLHVHDNVEITFS